MPEEEKVEVKGLTIRDLVRRAQIPRELEPVFHSLRKESFDIVLRTFEERAASYNQAAPCYEMFAHGPLSIVTIIYDKAWRLAQLTSPGRKDPLTDVDINRILDSCIDSMNFLSWLYALVVLASGYGDHEDSTDLPDYTGRSNKK